MPETQLLSPRPCGFLPCCWPRAHSALSPLHFAYAVPTSRGSLFWPLPQTPPGGGDDHGHALPAFELFLGVCGLIRHGNHWTLDGKSQGWCGARWPFREGNQLLISSAGAWRRKRLKEQGVFLEKLLAPEEPGVLPYRRWGWGGGRAGGSWSCLLSSAWPHSRSASADLT